MRRKKQIIEQYKTQNEVNNLVCSYFVTENICSYKSFSIKKKSKNVQFRHFYSAEKSSILMS